MALVSSRKVRRKKTTSGFMLVLHEHLQGGEFHKFSFADEELIEEYEMKAIREL